MDVILKIKDVYYPSPGPPQKDCSQLFETFRFLIIIARNLLGRKSIFHTLVD